MTTITTTMPVRLVNRLIRDLPRRERNRILKCCTPVELVVGTILCEPDQPFRHVYFPITGFISLVTTLGDHQPLEMGLIGNEGMLGVTVALGFNVAPMSAVVRGAGTALRMTATQLQLELRNSPRLLHLLNRYLYVLIKQFAQTSACTNFHEIEPRLAHWLLLAHDRAQADHFHLTHELLANMLGVRRSGITIAAGTLQKRKLIRYTRGEISIIDRKGLEAMSCKCYGAVIDDYERLFSQEPVGLSALRNLPSPVRWTIQ
jgi:CRP-like cAMP-binding protein